MKEKGERLSQLIKDKYTTVQILSNITGVSRPTISKRLKNNEWKRIEMGAIERVYNLSK